MNKAAARELLRQFDFKGVFLNELGWDDHVGSSFFIPMRKDTPESSADPVLCGLHRVSAGVQGCRLLESQ